MNAERKRSRVTEVVKASFNKFIRTQALSGILLLLASLLAIIWANSAFSDSYFDLWNTKLSLGFDENVLAKPLLLWINDGLMALFFFVVGLEIKREILVGELSTARKAALPVFAALGGMIVPALLYLGFNAGQFSAHGWGVPMATDIAFSLGILALLGSRAPLSLKIFLTALAIVDDLGAVLVIALFYSSDISLMSLVLGLGFLGIMLLANYLGIRNTLFYAIVGISGVWFAFLLSGVHATIAGVLAAMTIPARTNITPIQYTDRIQALLQYFKETPQESKLLSGKQIEVVTSVREACEDVEAPLQALEHYLHGWTTYLIMPIFALANAGIYFSTGTSEIVFHPVALGITCGLFLGKFLGISLFSFTAVKLGLASLPSGIRWSHIVGVSFLAGIGFTMSLFISSLAFSDHTMVTASKIGIFSGSVLSGLLGMFILSRTLKPGSVERVD